MKWEQEDLDKRPDMEPEPYVLDGFIFVHPNDNVAIYNTAPGQYVNVNKITRIIGTTPNNFVKSNSFFCTLMVEEGPGMTMLYVIETREEITKQMGGRVVRNR